MFLHHINSKFTYPKPEIDSILNLDYGKLKDKSSRKQVIAKAPQIKIAPSKG